MRLQAKSLISFGRSQRAQPAAASVDAPDVPLTTNMQSLAAELHQAAIQGLFEYSSTWLWLVRCTATALAVLPLAHILSLVLPVVRTPGAFPGGLLTWQMLGSVVGAAVAIFIAAVLVNFFPSIQVTPEGLGIGEAFGWRRISWSNLGVLRVMALPSRKGYAVFIPFTGSTRPNTPAPMLKFIPALSSASASHERGIFISSRIGNFERLLQLIVSYLAQASGQATPSIETFVDEEAVMPTAQLVLDPDAALTRISRNLEVPSDPYGVTSEDPDPAISWPIVLRKQLPIALLPALCLLVDVSMRNATRSISLFHVGWALVLAVLGMAELPFVGKLVQSVGEIMVGSGYFKRSVRAYVELQLPRAALVAVGIAVLGMGLPAQFAQAFWLVGIVLTTILITRFVQRIYYLPLGHTLIASIGTFVFQVAVLAFYFGVR